jgi:hypothetical protein
MTTPQVQTATAVAQCPRGGVEIVWTAEGQEKYACTCDVCVERSPIRGRVDFDPKSRFTRALVADMYDDEAW